MMVGLDGEDHLYETGSVLTELMKTGCQLTTTTVAVGPILYIVYGWMEE